MDRFDPQIPGGLIEGEFTGITITEPAVSPYVSNLVINPDQSFTVEMQWEIRGFLAPLWLAALGGSWSVEVFAESVGPGPEIRIASKSVPVSGGTTTGTTTRFTSGPITVPAGMLPEGNPGAGNPSGVYRLACSCFLNSNLGQPGYDIMGFAEGPAIMIENPL